MENLIKKDNTITWRDIQNADIIDIQKLDEMALNLTLAEYNTYYFDYPNTSVNGINYKTIDELITILKTK
jgi:ferritin-like protein